jgi:hypothetical protein
LSLQTATVWKPFEHIKYVTDGLVPDCLFLMSYDEKSLCHGDFLLSSILNSLHLRGENELG